MTFRPDLLSPEDKTSLQRELAAQGYYHGAIDGLWGPRSGDAFGLWLCRSYVGRVLVETDLTAPVRAEFERLFGLATLPSATAAQVAAGVARIVAAHARYEAVAASTGVPWYVVACLHQRECSGRFDQHLHNGDPLSARTVHVPAGRPLTGHAPFEWAYSAADALLCDGLTRWKDWSLAGTLHKLEAFNGYGYRLKGLPSPYLWNMTTLGRPGKYVADGKFDPAAVDRQPGCVALLLALSNAGVVHL